MWLRTKDCKWKTQFSKWKIKKKEESFLQNSIQFFKKKFSFFKNFFLKNWTFLTAHDFLKTKEPGKLNKIKQARQVRALKLQKNHFVFSTQTIMFMIMKTWFSFLLTQNLMGANTFHFKWLVVFIWKTNLSCFLLLCSMWNLSLLWKLIFPKHIFRKVMKFKFALQFLMNNKMCLSTF